MADAATFDPNATAPAAVSADTFNGKRSLATTRMFLFDLCERMFVRRDPVPAGQFREARDRESMLSVAEAMLGEIEKLAGAERAASIRERILRVLPTAEAFHRGSETRGYRADGDSASSLTGETPRS